MPARKTKPKEPEPAEKKKPITRWDFELTETELEQMAKRAGEWKKDTAKMVEWFEEKHAICFQIYFKMITNPLNSRSGPEKLLKSIDDFLAYGAGMMGAYRAQQGTAREDVASPARTGSDSNSGAVWKPPRPDEKEALIAERESARADGEPESIT